MAVTKDSTGTSAVSTGAALSFAGPVIVTPGMGTFVLVAVVISVGINGTSFGATVTYDGAAMTAVGTFTQLGSSTSRSGIGWFWMYHPVVGSKTIVVTPTGSTAKTRMAAFAQAYAGVDYYNTLGLNTINTKTTAASLTLSAPSYGGGVAGAGITIAATVNGAALSSPTQTQLYNNNVSVGGVGDTLLVQEAAGTGSNISFSSTGTATTPETESVRLMAASPASTLVEPFDDNSYGWVFAGVGNIAGGTANCTPASDGSTVNTPNNLNLLNSSISVEMKQVGTAPGSSGCDSYPIFLDAGFNTQYELLWVYAAGSGLIFTAYNIGAGRSYDSGVTYDPVSHKFFRIRETSGTVYWEVSADGTNWTTQRSVATPWVCNSIRQNFFCFIGSGGAAGQDAKYDNVNISPSIGGSLVPPVRRPNYGSLLQL